MDEQTPPTPPTPNDQPPANTDELATLRAELESTRDALAAARGEQAAGVTAARDALRAANPNIPARLIDGTSIAELNASIENAKAVAAEFATLAGGNGHAPKVPVGAQAPTVDLSTLSPFEKIRAGLAQRASA